MRSRYTAPVVITVNGEARVLEAGATVAAMLGSLGLCAQRVAVEVDREIVPRALFGQTPLHEGAAIEIVTFVGGG